jgi:hypothetical protein
LGIEDHQPQHAPITVTVNNRTVVFLVRQVTGAEMKATAIAQGVEIQQDFKLFRKKPNESLEPIGDAETVKLHEHEKFRAVAPDDNSGY